MTEEQQIKNIIAFLAILFGESSLWQDEIMDFSPQYLIEKFNRYVLSTRNESSWGLHPSLRKSVFEPYCKKHNLDFTQFEEIE